MSYEWLLRGSLQGVLLAREGRVALANDAAAALFEADSPAALEGLPLSRLLRVEAAQQLSERGDGTGGQRLGAVRASSLGGRALVLEVAALPIAWEGRDAVQLTLLDRTELHAAREALAGREAAFRDIIDGSLQGIYVHAEHRFLFTNRTFADMFGYASPAEVMEVGDVMALYAPHERERLLDYYRQRLGSGQPPVRYEFQGLRKDGSLLWLENQVRLVTWQGRQAVLATVVDISERKRAEQELLASEEKYRDVVQGSLQGILVQRHHKALFANQAFAELFGYEKPEDIYALDELLELVHPDQRDFVLAHSRARLAGTPDPTRYLGHVLHRDGRELWVDGSIRVVNWEGEPALQVVLIDVTERVQAQRELEAHQRLLQTVFDSIPHGVYMKGRDLRYQMANRAFCEGLGHPVESILGNRFDALDFATRDFAERIEAADRAVIASGQPEEMADVPVIRPNGGREYLHVIKYPLRDAQGVVTGVVGITEDVTQRTEAEERVRASEHLMRLVIDRFPYVIFVKDRDSRYRLVNRAFAEFHGLEPEAILGRTVNELPMGDAQDEVTFSSTDRQVMDTGNLVDIPEAQLTPVGGPPAVHHLQKFPLRDASDTIIGLVGLSMNITEHIRAQEALRASQRLLRLVIDTIPMGVYVKDREQRYQVANVATGAHFGRAVEDVVGHTLHELSASWTPDLEAMERANGEVLRTGRSLRLSALSAPAADGTVRRWDVTKLPLLDERGAVSGLLGTAEDVTERQRVEEELRSSRRLLQTVLDLLPLWVFVKDTKRRFLMVNRRMAEDHDLHAPIEPGTLLSLNPDIPDAERETIRVLDERLLETGEPVTETEMWTRLPRKGRRVTRAMRMPLRDEQGNIVGLVGAVEDITDRRRTEQAIQQAQKLESLGVLAGGIAHDFNNLLVSILGNVSLALMDLPADGPMQALLSHIETAGQRAADLCRQMLAYSGNGSFEIASVNLNSLIHEMTQLLKVSLAGTITLGYNFEPDLPAVDVDPTQIRQVVMNLVMNAAEAIGEELGHIQVTTRTMEADRASLSGYIQAEHLAEGRYVCVEVSDTGHGIAPEMLGRIFDPFFTTKFTGRGLGLAAVLGIVRGHNGGLQVTSVPGSGSTFRLLLPTQGAPPEAEAPVATDKRWRGEGTVLVVDDEAEVRAVLERMLDSLGFSVLQAADGAEAMECLAANAETIRLVLLDRTMPGMSGEETLHRVRQQYTSLPVLLMSGYAAETGQESPTGAGPRAVLQKPFTLNGLAEALQDTLG